MQDTRKWISVKYILPSNTQKVYYFSNFLGMFRGEYFYDKNSKGNPHKFYSEHGIVDADDISYWMPYDHTLRDMIPLPPDYMVDTSNFRSIINQGTGSLCEEIQIPDEYRQLEFTYTISGEI